MAGIDGEAGNHGILEIAGGQSERWTKGSGDMRACRIRTDLPNQTRASAPKNLCADPRGDAATSGPIAKGSSEKVMSGNGGTNRL